MIADVKTFLEADATLRGLLYGSAGNTKIYFIEPDQSGGRGETTPYLEIRYSAPGSNDNVIDEAMISINTVIEARQYNVGRLITNRLIVLLDVWEDLAITSADYHIYYSKMVGGTDSKAEDTDRFLMPRIFHFKYKRKTGG